jgi:hypothetical protein
VWVCVFSMFSILLRVSDNCACNKRLKLVTVHLWMLPVIKHRKKSGWLMHCSQGCDHVFAGRHCQLAVQKPMAVDSIARCQECHKLYPGALFCQQQQSCSVVKVSVFPFCVKCYAHLCFFLRFTVIHLVFSYVTLYFFSTLKGNKWMPIYEGWS